MTSGRPSALVFDWDNTLVDSWEAIHDALKTTFEAMGQRPWTLEETKARVRRSAREAFPDLFGARAEAAADIFYDAFARTHLRYLRPRPGAERLLRGLVQKGYGLSVVSNKRGDYLRKEAQHLGWTGYFRALVGAGDAPRDKPAPEAVELALKGGPACDGERSRVWFIGDTDIDLLCAVNSGCYSVLLREQSPLEAEFAQALPQLHVEGCDELYDLLISQRGASF